MVTSTAASKPEKLLIEGPAGALELVIDFPSDSSNPKKGIAVCCHPHPQHGGALTNKVIHTVAKSCTDLGLIAIRFNFRGVGKSGGEYANGQGEQDDLRAVVEWAMQRFNDHQLWLAGFSFGSYISIMQAYQFPVQQLISIAPPVFRFDDFDFSHFKHPGCAWLCVMGDADEVVDFATTERWVLSLEPRPEWQVMEGAGHFFHSRLVELRERLVTALKEQASTIQAQSE